MRDTLLYKARLAMPETSEADIGAQVDALMEKLGMTSARDTQVGLSAAWFAERAGCWQQKPTEIQTH